MARRAPARHGRSASRFTPRRWLPFVVLIALVAAGVVVSRRDTPVDSLVGRVPPPGTLLPVASRADSLSTAWYCAGGTASGSKGAAELSVVIANAEDEGLRADVTVVGARGTRKRATLEVPAAGRLRVVGSQYVTDQWIAMTVEVFGGRATVEREVAGPLGFDLSPCSTDASTRWLVPSGSTVRGARLDLVLYNPFPDATSVDISFATDQGFRSPRSLRGFSVPGRSLRVVPQEAIPPRRPTVATIVSARSGRLVVDRVQRYDGTGDAVGGTGDDSVRTPPPKGIGSTAAVPRAQARWLFPDAVVAPDVRTQVGIYNPSGRAARIDVLVRHDDPTRYPEVEPVQRTVPPRSVQVVDLSRVPEITPAVPFSVDVRSLDGVPVAAELLSFGTAIAPAPTAPAGDEPLEAGEEGADVAAVEPRTVDGFAVMPGAPVAARSWFVAGRGVSLAREASVTVANPGAATVSVTVTQLGAGRRSRVPGSGVRIRPGERVELDLGRAEDTGALIIDASGPVAVSHAVASRRTLGLAQALATPFPESVSALPAVG